MTEEQLQTERRERDANAVGTQYAVLTLTHFTRTIRRQTVASDAADRSHERNRVRLGIACRDVRNATISGFVFFRSPLHSPSIILVMLFFNVQRFQRLLLRPSFHRKVLSDGDTDSGSCDACFRGTDRCGFATTRERGTSASFGVFAQRNVCQFFVQTIESDWTLRAYLLYRRAAEMSWKTCRHQRECQQRFNVACRVGNVQFARLSPRYHSIENFIPDRDNPAHRLRVAELLRYRY